MSAAMNRVVVLGPQRLQPTLGAEVTALQGAGPLALITAGWQEREEEDAELREAAGAEAINLRLYGRWSELQAEDPEYFELHRARQDKLRQLQSLYQVRLSPLVAAARKLLGSEGEPAMLDPERQDAIEAIRTLDRHHAARVKEVRQQFLWSARPQERDGIVRHRQELHELVVGSRAVLIAGGHIAVLLNRLELFDLGEAIASRPVIAWSAGAMAITDRVVLFHDHPPQGAGDSELLDEGMGLLPDVVVLPHSRRRLTLADPLRVALMARRFAPARCVPMDEGDRLAWSGGWIEPGPGSRVLAATGAVRGGA